MPALSFLNRDKSSTSPAKAKRPEAIQEIPSIPSKGSASRILRGKPGGPTALPSPPPSSYAPSTAPTSPTSRSQRGSVSTTHQHPFLSSAQPPDSDSDASSSIQSPSPQTGTSSRFGLQDGQLPGAPVIDEGRFYSFSRRGSEPASRRSAGIYDREGGKGMAMSPAGDTRSARGGHSAEPSVSGRHERISSWTANPWQTSEPALLDHLIPNRPITPNQNTLPAYPTALSPPRRPMPRSPQANAKSYFPSSGISTTLAEAVSLNDPLLGRRASSPAQSMDGTSVSVSGRSTRVTAEWLARKPSSKSSLARSGKGNGDSDLGSPGLEAPAQVRASSGSTFIGHSHPRNTTFMARPQAQSRTSESTDASGSEDLTDSDGEVGAGTRTRSDIPLVGGRGREGAYEVEVSCVDKRDDGEEDEMRWEVIIRRKGPGGSSGPPSSPLDLSTVSSIAQAPSTASSINLSLSLDQPTGKLVFIAFPLDLHATPTRRRPSTSHSQTKARNSREMIPPRNEASTPPPRVGTPPHFGPTASVRPSTPVSAGRRKGSAGWPGSPGFAGPGAGPGASPVWTPRRTRMVSAHEVEGGLYARGVVDGLSEDLERVTAD